MLIDSAISAVGFVLSKLLCMYVHMPDTSEGFPSLSGSSVCVSALLPGELGVFGTFAGVLKLYAMLWA